MAPSSVLSSPTRTSRTSSKFPTPVPGLVSSPPCTRSVPSPPFLSSAQLSIPGEDVLLCLAPPVLSSSVLLFRSPAWLLVPTLLDSSWVAASSSVLVSVFSLPLGHVTSLNYLTQLTAEWPLVSTTSCGQSVLSSLPAPLAEVSATREPLLPGPSQSVSR